MHTYTAALATNTTGSNTQLVILHQSHTSHKAEVVTDNTM